MVKWYHVAFYEESDRVIWEKFKTKAAAIRCISRQNSGYAELYRDNRLTQIYRRGKLSAGFVDL